MFLWKDFESFASFGVNRLEFITEYLAMRGVKCVVMPIEGKNHLYVVFPKTSYNLSYKIKTVVAHYDVFPGSAGANDNSSAVFALMDWAVRLSESKIKHNVRLLFTDGEELAEGSGVLSQGAFSLASLFKKLGLSDDAVFVFDSVGRGTIPVIADSDLSFAQKKASSFVKRYRSLESVFESILQDSFVEEYCKLPVSYSDNAGFLASGIPALLCTMLPKEEVLSYSNFLQKDEFLKPFVMNQKLPQNVQNLQTGLLKQKLPLTWRLFHSERDNVSSITKESFSVMARILDSLAKKCILK